jgi:hypothetical protein
VRALLGPGAWRTYHATAQHRYSPLPLLCYYRTRNCRAEFTRDSTTTRSPSIDSLDSASGYFDIGVFSSVCSVCVHFWGPPSAPALHTACVRRRQRARATGAGSPGALLHARILSYARLWVPKKPSWSTRRPGSRRDEPGPGGVRVGATRTDLDCRVVATSRRVAPTECDSRLPLFSRASDSSTPGRHALATRGGSGIRLVAWLDSCVATCRPDRVRLVRYTSHVGGGPTRPTRPTLSDSVGRRCHGPRDSSDMRALESPLDSSTRHTHVRLLGLCRTKMSRSTRLVRHACARKSARLVDSSGSATPRM